MTGDNLFDIPPCHDLGTLIETRLVLCTHIPVEPLLPLTWSGAHEIVCDLRIEASLCINTSLRVLLICR